MVSIITKIHEYIESGRIKVKPKSCTQPVTYHDPCQIGRNFGLFEEPRDIVKQVCSNFVEMTPNREHNWCCGGGGGVVAEPTLEDMRLKSGKLKADQIIATGAKVVATPCENCQLQLKSLNEYYGLDVTIKSLLDLVTDALIIE
jgi:Fe-S oxidoreductase